MKFFIDTANLEQIKEAHDLGVLDGVTTNPSLMAKEGIKGTQNQRDHYVKICNIVNGDVSAEVIATDYEGMIREGEELAALNPHIVVKVPCSLVLPTVSKPSSISRRKEYARTVRWSFRWDRRCWRLKPGQLMYLLSSAVWMIFVKMG